MSTHELVINVEPLTTPTRADVYLANKKILPSRNQIEKLFTKSLVKTEDGKPLRGSHKLFGGETLIVSIPELVQSNDVAENIPLEILYEDADLAVINKQAGLVCHPGAGHKTGTLVNALRYHLNSLSSIGGVERPGLVHRLDKETSGILVIAKNDKTHISLTKQFQNRTTHRIYWALVAGVPRIPERRIQSHLVRHSTSRLKFASSKSESGKLAITNYTLQRSFKKMASLLKIKLETGRTHQIRVHLSEAEHPIIGDAHYGTKILDRLPKSLKQILSPGRHALHAAELGFRHPSTNNDMLFKSDWPDDLKKLLTFLEGL